MGNGKMKGHFVTPITITWRLPIHPKLQYDLIQQLAKRVKRQEPLDKLPQNFFSSTDGLCDGTYTYFQMESDAKTTLEQPNFPPTNPRSTELNSSHNPQPNCNDEYRYWNSWAALLCSTERIRKSSENLKKAPRNWHVAIQSFFLPIFGKSFVTNLVTTQSYLLQKHGR